MTESQTHLDQFGQLVYECPDCGLAFLTTLRERPANAAELEEALAFHRNGMHPHKGWFRRVVEYEIDRSIRGRTL